MSKQDIENPEKTGIVTLSLIGIGNNSTNIAIKAPKIRISLLIGRLIINPIIIHEINPAMDPDKVFLPNFIKGNCIPIIAANVSPTDKNNNASILNGGGINKIVNKAPTNTHVAPVNAPFFSFSLNIKPKYREKIIDVKLLFFLEISTKKQNIKKNDKIIIISILS